MTPGQVFLECRFLVHPIQHRDVVVVEDELREVRPHRSADEILLVSLSDFTIASSSSPLRSSLMEAPARREQPAAARKTYCTACHGTGVSSPPSKPGYERRNCRDEGRVAFAGSGGRKAKLSFPRMADRRRVELAENRE